MPYAHVYAKMTEEQKEKERARAREWHAKNYDRIREKKKQQCVDRYEKEGKHRYRENTKHYDFKLSQALKACKYRAKKNDVPFDLDLAFLLELWESQNGKCILTNREFYLGECENQTAQMNSLSIDRIQPSLGYTKGNVRLIVHHLNMAMSHFGLDALLKLVEDVKANNE